MTDLNRYQRALEAVERRAFSSPQRGGNSMLTFESALERDYLEHRRVETLGITRLGLLMAVVLYGSFFGLDALLTQKYQVPWTLIPILFVAGGLNLALLWTTYRPRFIPDQAWMSAVVVMVNGFAFAIASAYGYHVGEPIPPEPAVIQQIYALFLLNLPFRYCMPATVVIVSVFCVLHALAGVGGEDLFLRCFMMGAAGVLGIFACLLNERVQRLAWLRSRLLQEISEHDSLTGVCNHRAFYQRSELLLRQARRDKAGVAVLVGDVDHFKKFNDSHGHLAGDEALRLVAKALSGCARRPLDVVARLGGEEFGLMLYNVTPEAAHARAEDARNVVRGLALTGGRRVTISIGVIHAPYGSESTVEGLVGAADSALYRAKEAGRDRVSG